MKELIILCSNFVRDHPIPKGDFDFLDWFETIDNSKIQEFFEDMYQTIEDL